MASDEEIPAFTKHYQPGVPAHIELPTESVCEILDTAVAEAPKKTATVFFGAEMSYKELGDKVARAAEGLRQAGVHAGDRVAILLPNCPQHLIAFHAVMRLGAVVVEHNPLYTAPELEVLFADHGARVAIAMDTVIDKLNELPTYTRPTIIVAVNLAKALPKSKQAALALPVPKLRKARAALTSGTKGTMSFEKLCSYKPISKKVPKPGVNDLAAIQYTSGTTGSPKGAMLTHFNLYSNALQGRAWMHDAVKGQETSYAALPLFHSFGITVHSTFGVMMQMRQVMFPKPDFKSIVDMVAKYPPTVYCAVPVLYERTAEEAAKRGLSLKSAKYCISGAMFLPESTREKWEAVSGGLLVEGYGLTEASPVALGNPFATTRKPGTIGVPFPSTQMKVVSVSEPDKEVAQGEVGELCLKGPQIFKGYWHNPVETAATLRDGWLHTGDVVRVDDEGFTVIVDRKKDIIITGGFNVSPTEVEDVLRQHPNIADAAVFGERTDRGDEKVMAAVVLDGVDAIDRDATRTWAKERLAAYKVPRDFVAVDSIPRSPLGKILRNEVLDAVADKSK